MRRLICLCLVVVLSCAVAGAEEERAPIRTEEELQAKFDELWSEAVNEGFIKKETLKPNAVADRNKDTGRFAEVVGFDVRFYKSFFNGYEKHGSKLESFSADWYDLQQFTVTHELWHWISGHKPTHKVALAAMGECEANVFAVRLVGGGAINVLRALEFYSRSPLYFSTEHAVASHALTRALQVLEGKRKSCGGNGR